jgi:hypothetical protein
VIRGACLLALALVATLAAPRAQAGETVRLALLVGNNAGNAVRRPLRYAEGDAQKLGQVLNELGGFERENIYVLAGLKLDDVAGKLREMKARISAWREADRRVVLLFYFSGHSDGEALELGADRWAYREFLAQLKELGADVRIAIVDSCQSGSLLAHKGGVPGPTFDIRFRTDLATSGEAVLTSSAADEMALESRDIKASFFSHHLISGLRGAADSSGDGQVTLSEAYRYAFVNTLLATSGTLTGPQHPGYDYRISGQDELVLTQVVARSATLTLPDGFDQILIADEDHKYLVAELTRRSAHRIAVPSGRYVIQGRRGGRAYEARVKLAQLEARTVTREEFVAGSDAFGSAKGDADLSDAEEAVSLSGELGVLRGVADSLPWLGGVKLTVRAGDSRGVSGGLELATGSVAGFRESTARVTGGGFVGWSWKRLGVEAGWRLLAGVTSQNLDAGGGYWSWEAGTGPWLGAAVTLGARAAIVLTAGADGLVLRRDEQATLVLSPNANVGLRLGF